MQSPVFILFFLLAFGIVTCIHSQTSTWEIVGTSSNVEIYSITPDTFYSDVTTTFKIKGKRLDKINIEEVSRYLNTFDWQLKSLTLNAQNDSILSFDLSFSPPVGDLRSIAKDMQSNVSIVGFKKFELNQPLVNLGEFSPEISSVWLKGESIFSDSIQVLKKNNSNFRVLITEEFIGQGSVYDDSLVVYGKNLLGKITLESPFDYYTSSEKSIDFGNRERISTIYNRRPGEMNVELLLANDTTLNLGTIEFVPPILPTKAGSLVYIICGMLAVLFIIVIFNKARYSFYNKAILERNVKEKSLIDMVRIISFCIPVIILLAIAGSAMVNFAFTTIENNSNDDLVISQYIVWIGILVNVVLTLLFSIIIEAYSESLIKPFEIRPLSIAIIFFAITSPILIQYNYPYLDINLLGSITEIGLFGGILILGSTGFNRINGELRQTRDNAETKERILKLIEQELLTQGKVDYEQMLSNYPREVVAEIMQKVVKDRETKWGIQYEVKSTRLVLNRGNAINRLNSAFKAATSGENQLKNNEQLIQTIRDVLQFKQGKSFSINSSSNSFSVYSHKADSLESVLPNPFPQILYNSPDSEFLSNHQKFRDILNQLDAKNRFAILTPISPSKIPREEITQTIGQFENIPILYEEDYYDILARSRPIRNALMDKIQEQIDLIVFSPYKTKAPTTGDMFYGRKRHVGTILEKIQEGSVAIIGARRMGKTSVLQSVQNELLQVERKTVLLYLDCYPVKSYSEFMKEIRNRWRIGSIDMSNYQEILDFPKLVVDIQNEVGEDQSIVFQLDEIDGLLRYDNQEGREEQFFRMLRSLAQENRCQFNFSGERLIVDQLVNPNSCFFNFPIPVKLELFDKSVTTELVRTPMSLIGIRLEHDDIPDIIWEYTSGHPNLIQSLCHDCLEQLSDDRVRVLSKEIVLQQCRSSQYRDTFLKTFWSQSTYLEQAIGTLIIKKGSLASYRIIDELKKFGFNPSIEEIDRGLRYLTLSQVLTSSGDEYRTKPSKFHELLFDRGYPFETWMSSYSQAHKPQINQ